MKAKPKKKRPSGYAQAKASGKVVVMLQLTPDQAAVIDLAATHEGRSRTNYIAYHAHAVAYDLACKMKSEEDAAMPKT